MLKCGSKVQDKASPFKGTVVARYELIGGSTRIFVEGIAADNTPLLDWFDESRFTLDTSAPSDS